MHHRQQQVLTVRRIAVVFEALCPKHVDDDTMATRLKDAAELACEIAGVEVLEHDAHAIGAELAGGRKGFWDRRAARHARVLPASRGEVS